MYKFFLDFLATLLLTVLFGCEDDSVNAELSYPVDEVPVVDSLKHDTVFVERVDTVADVRVDTFVVDRIDTVFLTPSGKVKKCRTDFDSTFVPGKSVFLGNSLLLGFSEFGMSASAADKDYYHRLESYFKEKEIPFEGRRITGLIERMLTVDQQEDFLRENVYPYLNDSTGLVVIQLGDNVNAEENFVIMEQGVSNILSNVCAKAPNARVIWVGEWYVLALKQFLLKRVAEDYGVTFVDISDLSGLENQARIGNIVTFPYEKEFEMGYESYKAYDDSIEICFHAKDSLYNVKIEVTSFKDDAENKVISWTGKEFIVFDPDVASHPSDLGFEKITERILQALGYEK